MTTAITIQTTEAEIILIEIQREKSILNSICDASECGNRLKFIWYQNKITCQSQL